MRRIALAFLVLIASCSACRTEYIDPVTHDVVDCTKANSGAIVALIATFATDVLNGGGLDWGIIRQQAITAGKDIGGCALAMFTQHLLAPAPGVRAPDPLDAQNALDTLESVRVEFGGKVVWQDEAGQAL
jgi:hypothetical protein